MSPGRLKGNALGFVFLAVGAVLLAGAAYAYNATITRPLSWPRAEARVVSSRVVNPKSPGQHQAEIVFELNDGSGPRRITTVPSWSSSSYDAVRSYVDGYPAGARVVVAVNPADPGDVRHELGPTVTNLFLPGVLAFLGAIFAVCGLAPMMWRAREAGPDGSARTLRLVSALFVAIGVGLGGIGAWLWSQGTALDWPEVEATAVAGAVVAVDSTSAGKRTSRPAFDIQVTFAYDVDGVRITSRTMSGNSSSSRTGAEERLRAYERGSRHRIRHRPGDPNVIRFEVTAFRERILPAGLLLMGLVFLGFGIMMRAMPNRRGRKSGEIRR